MLLQPMPTLRDNPRLADIQRYVTELERERGFDGQTVLQKCLLLGEEVGELFRAVRKHEGMPFDHNEPKGGISEELADVLIYLCAIANRSGVDLETAFRKKEEVNKTRVWS